MSDNFDFFFDEPKKDVKKTRANKLNNEEKDAIARLEGSPSPFFAEAPKPMSKQVLCNVCGHHFDSLIGSKRTICENCEKDYAHVSKVIHNSRPVEDRDPMEILREFVESQFMDMGSEFKSFDNKLDHLEEIQNIEASKSHKRAEILNENLKFFNGNLKKVSDKIHDIYVILNKIRPDDMAKAEKAREDMEKKIIKNKVEIEGLKKQMIHDFNEAVEKNRPKKAKKTTKKGDKK